MYQEIGQEYADMWILLTGDICAAELADRGVVISARTVKRHFQLLKARKKNCFVKPSLSPAHKAARMEYILDQADRDHGLLRPEHRFRDQKDTVHIDESWFYLTTVDRNVLVWDDIFIPDSPTVRHKSHITKVMFLVAMARPQAIPGGGWFDGKVGMWQCTEEVLTQRASVNRPAGVYETRPRSVDSEFYHELCTMEGGVLDKVKEAMPWRKNTGIKIQHDGAGPHNGKGNTEALRLAGLAGGWKIKFVTQPAQSPDLNILDLGFFHSLKSRVSKLKMGAHNLVQLIEKVRVAYEQYNGDSLTNIWAHQIACWRVILQVDGDNQYPAPHEGARRRVRHGDEAVDLTIDVEEYNRVFDMLNEQ
jgi:hypothetical protein